MGTSRRFKQMCDMTIVLYIYIYIKGIGLLIRLCPVLVVAHRTSVVGAGSLVVV